MPGTHPIREYFQRVEQENNDLYKQWDASKPLPKLPVPDLNSTLDKYLQVLQPVLSEEEYERTKKIVDEFGREGGEGEILQEQLKKFAETKDNWVVDWWLKDMYLDIHLPLPVNSNPGMVMPRMLFNAEKDRLRYAAQLITGILDYKIVIDSRSIPIDRCRSREKGQPLCMDQYYRIFYHYRRPGVHSDVILNYKDASRMVAEHIVVACNNQFYTFNSVINNERITEEDLIAQLGKIVRIASSEQNTGENPPLVGTLTSLERNEWGRIRQMMIKDAENKKNLECIETAILLVCLDGFVKDDVGPPDSRKGRPAYHMHRMLHGNGTKEFSANRWFDKNVQYIIGYDGICGVNYEHSSAEAIALTSLFDHVMKYLEELRIKSPSPGLPCSEGLETPQKLEWTMTPDLQKEVDEAVKKINILAENTDCHVLRYMDYGTDFPKSQKMSPDAFLQLALQLTYYKIHHKLTSTYESAATRRFRFGRVDTIRASSMPALSWSKAMIGETEVTDAEKYDLFLKAIEWQTKYMVDTIMGYGIDSHMLGLKTIAKEMGMPSPAIFEDEAFTKSNYFQLSTSQVPVGSDSWYGYGAVVPDGYACCYNPQKDWIIFNICTFDCCEDTDSQFFALCLESSLMQMKETVLKGVESRLNNGVALHAANGNEPALPKVRPRKTRSNNNSPAHVRHTAKDRS
ncbi:choline O-acetyltransferase-like [Tubulanus polymorphus]|uniref:choline O-acetyltransferase-like n=1 Tax=Tubulanus polymorphus TaxID=672921 RepID=UPI003DA4DEDE